MSQNFLNDSEIQSSKIGLKPAIAAALGSLEVQLDQELTRYRRMRSLQKTSNPSLGVNYIPSPSPQVNTPKVFPRRNQSSVRENQMTVTTQETLSLYPTSTEKPEHLPISPPEESSKTDSSSSIVPMMAKTAEKDQLLPPPELTPQHPDDYLESSEALLRSLNEAPSEQELPRNNSDSLLSPLGIGSMLLLLAASLTLGYVVFNPKTLPKLNLAKLLVPSPPTIEKKIEVMKTEPPSTDQGVEAVESSELKPIPKYPNLAANEFPEVRNPNDVVGLKPKPQPIPVVINTPLAIPSPVNPVVPVNSAPIPRVPPLSLATATPSPSNIQIKPSADGFYHLVTDNQGIGTLAIVQKVVPDAYLSRNRKFIYLGTLKNPEEVKLRLQELQEQGIKAHIQKR